MTSKDVREALEKAGLAWKPEQELRTGEPAILFSPYDEDLNCEGGLIWVSGGWGKAAIVSNSWRGESIRNPPTLALPLSAIRALFPRDQEERKMGTKNDPGRFDCHGNAAPDEPIFTLRGKDRHAAMLVRLWAQLRAAEGEPEDVCQEAMRCADAMDNWREQHDGKAADDELAAAVRALGVLVNHYRRGKP